MATTADSGVFGDALKKVYSKGLTDKLPEHNYFNKLIPWGGNTARVGEEYVEAVKLKRNQGITYGGLSTDAYAFNNAISGSIGQARVQSYQMNGVADLSDDLIARAMEDGSKASFVNATKETMKDLMESMRYRLEMTMLYGQDNIGVVASVSNNVITITAASWAGGIWAGQTGAMIQFRDPSSGAEKATTQITAIDWDDSTRQITVQDATGVTADDTIHFAMEGDSEAIGIHKALTTSTGNLFGLSTETNDVWRGNQYAVGGALTRAKVVNAITSAISGGYAGDCVLLVNPNVWDNIMEAEASLRSYDSAVGESKFINGAQFVKLNTQVGVVEVIGHPYVKVSNGYVIKPKTWKRVGAHDVKLGRPGPNSQISMMLPGNAGHRVFASSHQAIFCNAPSHNIVLTGITSTHVS